MKPAKRIENPAGRKALRIGLGPLLLLFFFPGLALSVGVGGEASKGGQKVISGLRELAPLPAQDAWSIQRRLESLGDEDFLRTGHEWVHDRGEPARQALLLCAGSTPSPGLSISGKERRARQTALALQIVSEGLSHKGKSKAWRSILREALAYGELPGGNPDSPLGGQGALAAINVVAALQLTSYSDSVAGHMADPVEEGGAQAVQVANANAPQRDAFLLHDEAQACLFRLYGVWFASRHEFMAFPRPPAGQAGLFREVFSEGAKREADLALELLEVQAASGLNLLKHPDPVLRGKAVARLIRAVGEQSLTASSVREVLATSVLRESNPEVCNAMLNGLLDLSLAADPDSQAVQDLRITLQGCSQAAPIAMVPSLLSAFDRLPRPAGEAGRNVAEQDGHTVGGLLESLWNPVLRLDRDTTILALRAWSRVQSKLHGFAVSLETQKRAGTHVLHLMGDSSEPERVRLVAAEALLAWPLDKDAMGKVLQTLATPESSAHLRGAAYPLVKAGLQHLPWEDLDGPGLMNSLLRDMGHGNVDLRGQVVRLASSELLANRLVALEAQHGQVLSLCLNLFETEASSQVRTGLMDLIIALAGDRGNPDLLADHLQRPVWKAWIASGEVDLAHLSKTYLALAGDGAADLVAHAGLLWENEANKSGRAFEVTRAALEMLLALDEDAARALAPKWHGAIHDMALIHLLNSGRNEALQWSKKYGQRLLSVHLTVLAETSLEQGEEANWKKTSYLEAKLLVAAVVEDDTAIQKAFDSALDQCDAEPARMLLVMRDRARFLDSFGKADRAKARWDQLVQWLSEQSIQIPTAEKQPGLDFEDLGHMTSAASRVEYFSLLCKLWQARSAHSEWKSLGPESCMRELNSWAQAVEETKLPELLDPWLQFVKTNILSVGSDAGWLKLPNAEQAAFGELVARLRGARSAWAAALEVEPEAMDPDEEKGTKPVTETEGGEIPVESGGDPGSRK
ncbi:MAG: hypothetical protein GY930_01305 [bacterium]|nr:hypothetical protein [bacterium]